MLGCLSSITVIILPELLEFLGGGDLISFFADVSSILGGGPALQ